MKINVIKFIILLTMISHLAFSSELEYHLTLQDHKFSPQEIIVPEGEKFILIVENTDDTIEEFESFDLKREKIIPSKKKVKIILGPLKIGEYKFFGDFHQETANGKIIVKKLS